MRPVFWKSPTGAPEKVRTEMAFLRNETSLPPFASRWHCYAPDNVAKPSLIPDSVLPATRLRPSPVSGPRPRSDPAPPQRGSREPGKEESP
jgi:hypothetical protein